MFPIFSSFFPQLLFLNFEFSVYFNVLHESPGDCKPMLDSHHYQSSSVYGPSMQPQSPHVGESSTREFTRWLQTRIAQVPLKSRVKPDDFITVKVCLMQKVYDSACCSLFSHIIFLPKSPCNHYDGMKDITNRYWQFISSQISIRNLANFFHMK